MQEDIQYYFDIADSLLKDLNATQRESKPDTDPNRCVACGSVDLVLCYADGCYVCSKCGEVAMQPVFERAQMFVRKFSRSFIRCSEDCLLILCGFWNLFADCMAIALTSI